MRQASRSLTTRSIRFRMTALYTLLLALLFLALSYSLSTLLERRLSADVDNQILSTAHQVFDQVKRTFPQVSGVYQLDPLASADQYIQIVDAYGNVLSSSSNLGDVILPAAPINPNDSGPVYQTATVDGLEIRTVHLQITTLDGDLAGAINVGESLTPLTRTLSLLHELLIPISIVGVALAALGGWLLAGRALRPVDRITATAAAIGAGSDSAASLSTRLTVPDTGDEVARLAETFNAMLDRLEATFAAQQRFVADASHELRTPLTAIRGNVDVLLRQARANLDGGVPGDDLAAALEDVARESARMGRLIEGLLILARSDAGAAPPRPTEPVRLDLVAEHAVRTASALAEGQELSLRAPEPVLVPGDYDRLVQVMLILLENAIRHTPAGGRITVDVAQTAGDRAQVTVSDTGEGIAPEHLPHIFERFYRADTARARVTGGTGLGLAIAQAILRRHGGTIAVRSALGVGSTFTVTLPALPAQSSVQPPPNIRFLRPRSEAPANGHATPEGDAADAAGTGDTARLR